MVNIAIAGGSGSEAFPLALGHRMSADLRLDVALEVMEKLISVNKHSIIILSRSDRPETHPFPTTKWLKISYTNTTELFNALLGVHTVLSFITTQSDPENSAQKNLIDACVQAGVTRFAPSEWATSSTATLPIYHGKLGIRRYLEELNHTQKVLYHDKPKLLILEYSLFQPGLFTNYFAHPHKSATYFHSFETHIDFQHCRALVIAEQMDETRLTLTTVQDLAQVVTQAVEFEGEWPVVGGIQGSEVTIRELLEIGAEIRGQQFEITELNASDLLAEVKRCPWLPLVDHPGMPSGKMATMMAPRFVADMLWSMSEGALHVTDEWNRLLPHYEFTSAADFLREVWRKRTE